MHHAQILIETIINGIDSHSQVLQEVKTIIVPDVILRAYAEDGKRILVPAHFPHYWCKMINIIKSSNEKQEHLISLAILLSILTWKLKARSFSLHSSWGKPSFLRREKALLFVHLHKTSHH